MHQPEMEMTDAEWLEEYAEKVRRANFIDPALYRKYGVKRGLRNDDGTGVLVGLTTIGNVHGYVTSASLFQGNSSTAESM